MTNRIAAAIVLAVAALLALDAALGAGTALLLARRGLDLVDWLAVWR